MTREEAAKILDVDNISAKELKMIRHYNGFYGQEAVFMALKDACSMAVAALREQDERENVWHDAKNSPPEKPGVYYGKVDDTDSMYACQYRDGVWTMNAYPETKMTIIKWAYYDAFTLQDEKCRWIPVAEQKPDLIHNNAGTAYSEAVMILTSGRKVMDAIWDGFDWIAPFDFWEAWGEKVTHWMPLPELPQED